MKVRTRYDLRYDLAAFRACVRALATDPQLDAYYDGSLPPLLEQTARSLARFIPGMPERLRVSLFNELGALPVFEPPGLLFTMWEALLPPPSPSYRASLYPRRRVWRVKHLA